MAWGATFLSNLEAMAKRPRLRLVLQPSSTPAWTTPGTSTEIVLTNYRETGSYECLGNTCRVGGASLDPYSRRYQVSQLDVSFVGPDVLRAILDYYGGGADTGGIRRGSVVELQVGFPGMAVANYETVFTGQLRNIVKAGGTGSQTEFRITAYDIVGLMASYTNGSGVAGAMFADSAGAVNTTVSLNFTAGSGGPLTVASTTNFTRRTGGSGLLYCFPSGGGSPFFLDYTGTTGITFTGCGTGNIFNTTQANLVPGDVIWHVPWVYGHPVNILREMAASTGAGTNGAYDVYPAAWGWAIPASYIDISGMGSWVTPTGAGAVWNLISEVSQPQPMRWLEDRLSKYGVVPVMCQGQLSVRALQAFYSGASVTPAINLTNDYIESVTGWEAFNSSQTFEIKTLNLVKSGNPRAVTAVEEALKQISLKYEIDYIWPGTPTTAATSGGAAATLPILEELTIDESDMTWGPGGTTASPLSRLEDWLTDSAERIGLASNSLQWAQLCVGDRPKLTTPLAFGATEARNGGTGNYSTADVMVVSGPDVDWIRGTVELEVLRPIGRVL